MLTRWFSIRGHGIGGALQAVDGLRFGFVDRFCAGRKSGTAHPACAGVPEPYLLHEDSHWIFETVPSAFASGSARRPDTLVRREGKAFRPEIRVGMVQFSLLQGHFGEGRAFTI